MTNRVLQTILQKSAMNRQASGYYNNNILPGVASKVGQKSPFQIPILPENGGAVRSRVPIGQPISQQSIAAGLPAEDSVTIVLDMTGLGDTLTKETIVLFDEGGYYRAKNGIATAFPAGTVYIGSAANNLYDPYVSGTCAESYHYAGVKIDVSTTATAAATAELQFQEKITHHMVSARETISSELEVSNFNDPANFDRNSRIIPLTDRKSRIDRQTAWVLDVYHGSRVTLTFYVVNYSRA